MIWIVLAFCVYLIPLGLIVYRTRWVTKRDDYFVAYRAVPAALVFGSICGTYIGPGFSFGFIGKGFQSGLLFWLMGGFYAVQTILVGVFIAPNLRKYKDVFTLGGIYRTEVGKAPQALIGILSVGLCAGFSAVMVKAGGAVIQSYFGWPFWASAIFVTAITTSYTLSGGLRGSISTDGFQFLFFTVLLPAVMLWLITSKVSIKEIAQVAGVESSRALHETPFLTLLSLSLAFLLGETLIPPYANRALASKDRASARSGFIWSGVFAAIWFLVMLTIGISARQLLPPDVPEDRVLIELLKLAPLFMQALVGLTLLGIVMSSLGPLMNSGAISTSEDIIALHWHTLGEKQRLLVSRLATIGIAAIATLGAIRIQSIISGLLLFYSIWAPAILPSLIYILFTKRPSTTTTVVSITLGTCFALLRQFHVIHIGLEPILCGLIGGIGSIVLLELWRRLF